MDEPVINEREQKHAEDLTKAHAPIREWWFKDNVLMTVLFNASSATVPEGERFIVRAARDAQKFLSDEHLEKQAETLMHEETAHARMHDAYNAYLEAAGFPAEKHEAKTKKLLAFFEKRISLKSRLAICMMIEHYTALFSKQILDEGIFEGADVDERMDRVWSWHCLEEMEHRSTAIDLYRAVGGGYLRRVFWATVASFFFMLVHVGCMLDFLNGKKLLWKKEVWKTGWPLIFGKKGVYYLFLSDWVLYFKFDFHPSQIPILNRFNKQLHHYHIEDELVGYFKDYENV